MVSQQGVSEAITTANALEEAAFHAVSEEFAVVPRAIAEQPESDTESEVCDRANKSTIRSSKAKSNSRP